MGRSSTQPVGHLLRVAAWTVVTALCLNSILILVLTRKTLATSCAFWSNPTVAGTTVAEQALLGDRYGGIFNQPFDGGVGYAVGVIAWIYLFSEHSLGRGLRSLKLLALALIISGGVSTQSKVFVYGALLNCGGHRRDAGGHGPSADLDAGCARFPLPSLPFCWQAGSASWTPLTAHSGSSPHCVKIPTKEYSGLHGITGGRQDSAGGWFEDFFESLSLTGGTLWGSG